MARPTVPATSPALDLTMTIPYAIRQQWYQQGETPYSCRTGTGFRMHLSGFPTNRELTQVCDINGRHPMKRTAGTLYFITVMFLLVACDPAIAIRQIRASNGTSAPITIDVRTRYPLVGERIYEPQVTVTDGSDLPIRTVGDRNLWLIDYGHQ